MSVLVINCGSTSAKIDIVNPDTGDVVASSKLERLEPGSHASVLTKNLPAILEKLPPGSVTCVGHRVVHGGEQFVRPTVITPDVLKSIEELSSLAPLHNPANAAGISAALELLPDVPHVAVFDTAFHATLSRRSATYAIPTRLAEEHKIRRFGFHGTSHQFVAESAAKCLGEDLRDLRIITCHLGGGCSICAVEYGRSVETSMGMTPLEGLVMGTRSGDIDAGAILHLMRSGEMSIDDVDQLLNKRSGLAGLSGIGNDMRDIEAKAAEGDENCRLAIQVFCHRVRKYIGAYTAVMGGVDAIVFTAGIGENSQTIRHRVAQRMDYLGARLDEDRNRDVALDDKPVAAISAENSRVKILVAKTNESLAIARLTAKTAAEQKPSSQQTIPVAISARHVHLRQETVEALFGDGYELTELKPLSQPGQFAANECVTLIGPKRSIERVRILGPTRSKDQVEIARTDEFFLGLDAPVRASGKVENTPGITLEGTDGRRVVIPQGVICAWRHIHMTPKDAEQFGVENGDIVNVTVGEGGGRTLTFGDVLIRVKSTYKLEMHIDTDEGNAAELSSRDEGELSSTSGQATLTRNR